MQVRFQVHNFRAKMISTLREKFAHLNLTFSIGGQISFDVSITSGYTKASLYFDNSWIGGKLKGKCKCHCI